MTTHRARRPGLPRAGDEGGAIRRPADGHAPARGRFAPEAAGGGTAHAQDGIGPFGAAARAWAGLVDLVLPADCAACGAGVHGGTVEDDGERAREGDARGAVPVTCRECAAQIAESRFGADAGGPWPELVGRAPPTWATAPYGGALGHLLVAYKDGGRRDARGVLAGLLAPSLLVAVAQVDAVTRPRPTTLLVVPVPSRPRAVRERGDRPVHDLARAAARLAGDDRLVVAAALAHRRRRIEDQAGLGRRARLRNLRGALHVPPRQEAFVRGRDCVVVDDVTTSGATLAESARALRAAGAGLVVAATLAHTP